MISKMVMIPTQAKALQDTGFFYLAQFSVKFSQVYLHIETVADPRADFRAVICTVIPPMEYIASPEANFWTEIGQGFRLWRL